jgi:hypothetical protein
MTAARAQVTCEQCGQTDDHPKVHIGAVTKHYDCLSAAEKQQTIEAIPSDPDAVPTADIIAKAESGTHGNDLLSFILKSPAQKGAK